MYPHSIPFIWIQCASLRFVLSNFIPRTGERVQILCKFVHLQRLRDVEVSINGSTRKSSSFMGFSIINRPFWIHYGNPHILVVLLVLLLQLLLLLLLLPLLLLLLLALTGAALQPEDLKAKVYHDCARACARNVLLISMGDFKGKSAC